MNTHRPPYDEELALILADRPDDLLLTHENLPAIRSADGIPPIEQVIEGRGLVIEDYELPAADGTLIGLSVLRPAGTPRASSAGIYYIHGGGMVVGHRWGGGELLATWVENYGVTIGTIEYRLAPEFPAPTPVEDCFAGLKWFSSSATELGFDPARVVVAGASAGGGLAAGTVLMARDNEGPDVAAQLLMCPMLDDRNNSVSAEQFHHTGLWDWEANDFGWRALLGEHFGTDSVSIYSAPARAGDLSGLPPAYIDVGSADLFRDEDAAYASRIWGAGGVADLHVWAGGYHGFEYVDSAVSRSAVTTRENWLSRYVS